MSKHERQAVRALLEDARNTANNGAEPEDTYTAHEREYDATLPNPKMRRPRHLPRREPADA